MSQPLTVDCPTCGAPVEWNEKNAYRPFCSDRCKLIDLGAWAAEEHKIPVAPDAEDELFSGSWSRGTELILYWLCWPLRGRARSHRSFTGLQAVTFLWERACPRRGQHRQWKISAHHPSTAPADTGCG